MDKPLTPDELKRLSSGTSKEILSTLVRNIGRDSELLELRDALKSEMDRRKIAPEPDEVKSAIAAEAAKIVNGARRGAYGTPEQNFERIATLWNAYLVARGVLPPEVLADPAGKNGLTPPDVAAFMRLMKEARIIETPDHRDSFVDLVGYALCGAEVSGVKP